MYPQAEFISFFYNKTIKNKNNYVRSNIYKDLLKTNFKITNLNEESNSFNKFINDKYIEYECTLEGNLNQKLSVRIDPDVVSLIYLLFSILCIYVNLYFAIRILIDLNLKWVMRVI